MSYIQPYLRCARSGDMIPDSHGTWCKYDEAAAEIERLREQVATYLTCYESEQKARKRLWKRVREALGDE